MSIGRVGGGTHAGCRRLRCLTGHFRSDVIGGRSSSLRSLVSRWPGRRVAALPPRGHRGGGSLSSLSNRGLEALDPRRAEPSAEWPVPSREKCPQERRAHEKEHHLEYERKNIITRPIDRAYFGDGHWHSLTSPEV